MRAKRATAAGRQARIGENVPRTAKPGPGGLPLALRLSKGLGLAPREVGWPLPAPDWRSLKPHGVPATGLLELRGSVSQRRQGMPGNKRCLKLPAAV